MIDKKKIKYVTKIFKPIFSAGNICKNGHFNCNKSN